MGISRRLILVIAWIAWGFGARWSQTWLLWPSAIASVVTFLIAFSLQYTQNRDTRAMQLKLDELLRGTPGARTGMMKLEELSDPDLDAIEREIARLRNSRGDSQDSTRLWSPPRGSSPGRWEARRARTPIRRRAPR